MQQIKTRRIESIDVVRGLTILVMIFVNDLSGVVNVPAWMKHATSIYQMMTFVDWVFPGFLFIVGMSMPFSIRRRIEKGGDRYNVWKHILVRVAGLLILGFFMVNGDHISDQGVLNPHLWILLMYIFAIIIWNRNSDTKNFFSKKWVKYSAIAGLIILFFIYTSKNQTGLVQMRPYWWGILGLIGWAYLCACLFYIPLRKNQPALIGSVVLLYCFYMAFEAGMLGFIGDFMNFGFTFGSHTGIILTGAILGNQILENLENPDHKKILKWACGFSMFLFIAALLLYQLKEMDKIFLISKNKGTIPWCLLSSAFTIWIWMAIYWFVDMKGFGSWFKIMEPAGKNPLFAYILAPLLGECFALIALAFNGFNFYEWFGEFFFVGLLRAVVIAFSMTWLAGYLSKKGFQLRL